MLSAAHVFFLGVLMSRVVFVCLLLVVFVRPLPAWSFGADGHEAICEIAYLSLNTKAKTAVDRIMKAEPDTRFQTFRQSCVWPDYRGGVQSRNRPNHYINVPRNHGKITSDQCIGTQRCLFSAIRRDLDRITSSQSSAQGKLEALKFLGHWVGDIHQPLHVSFKDDRGGNDILLKKGIGCRPKLHDVWDSCIPRHLMKKMKVRKDRLAFGRELHARLPAEAQKWASQLDMTQWARESYALARQSSVKYCTQKNGACWYSNNRKTFKKNTSRENDGRRVLSLTTAYEDAHAGTVKRQIQKAGVRLGALLNQHLGQ